MIDERVDIAVRMSPNIDASKVTSYPLATVRQVLVASPEYLKKFDNIETPKDLQQCQLIAIDLVKDPNTLEFVNGESNKKTKVKIGSRIQTNNIFVATTLAKAGHGLVGIMALDIEKELASGELVEVLPEYQLPTYQLYAVTLDREQQPAKITRCLEVLQEYFADNTSI